MRQKWGKEVSRSKEEENDMEGKMEEKKVRRMFSPEQNEIVCLCSEINGQNLASQR